MLLTNVYTCVTTILIHIENISTSPEFCAPLQSVPHPNTHTAPGNHWCDFCHCRLVLPVEFHIKRLMLCTFLCPASLCQHIYVMHLCCCMLLVVHSILLLSSIYYMIIPQIIYPPIVSVCLNKNACLCRDIYFNFSLVNTQCWVICSIYV